MRVVLEVGDWVLAEDDEGEVRLWSNGVTGETRSYEDVPPEVEAALSSDDGPPLQQPSAQPPPSQQPLDEKPPQAAAPFRLACGAAAEPQAAAPFKRACGVAAEPAVSTSVLSGAPMAGRAAVDIAPMTRSTVPEPFAGQPQHGGYANGASAGHYHEPEADGDEALPERTTVLLPSSEQDASVDVSGPVAEPEPEPCGVRPEHLPELAPREPTPAMLTKATSMRLYQGQSREDFLGKLTHVHLAEKGLTSLGATFQLCPRLRVLNLESNHLQELSGVRPCCEVLHLHGNNVWDLSSWTQNLPSLVTLDLSENRLSVLSGLGNSRQLEELSLRSQTSDLPLRLHPPTLRAFSRTLKTLDISRNRMSDIDPVASLVMLQRLDASCNMLAEMTPIGMVLQRLSRLSRLCLEENPICWMRKYRDLVIIAASQNLEHLDGKEVNPNERPFLVELHQRRRRRNSSEPPQKVRSGNGSPAGSGSSRTTAAPSPETRSASLGRACPPRPPCDLAPPPGGIPCMARHRSRSSSVDPAARHYRRRSGGATKLPPLPPRV